ncbi:Metallo-dependent hydrolase [Polyplosphaeria fusca]|uniref:Metallo-dependent hydrolase n=1 Tax=Polyplosphaeria fusca TaxID=682080 RepID=A0A9P4V4D1_9PLEO|nr:Metallo-dependent hydrolase [Polyplosphaeria fusca]
MTEKGSIQDQQKNAHVHFDAALASPNLDRYKQDRERLLKDEDSFAWDWNARQDADENEKRAQNIIWHLREFERDKVFGNVPGEELPQDWTLDMGGQFLTNKKRIGKQSKLFEIAMMVPKGALLHLHFNAELHPERLLQEARSMPNMFIRSTQPIEKFEHLQETEVVFNVMPIETTSNSIFKGDYQGTKTNWKPTTHPEMQSKIFMKWSEFREEFDREYGRFFPQKATTLDPGAIPNSSEEGKVQLTPAEIWVKQKMVLSENEAYGISQTVNGVWARFNQATRAFKGLLNYEQVYKWYISNAIDRMIYEKVMYAELRPMLLDKDIPTTDGRRKIDNAGQMELIVAGVKAKQEELERQGKLHLFPFGLKIVYCTPRSIPPTLMQKEMKHCIDLKMQFPNLICGFDLVGAEDRPNHIGFYQKELVAFQKTCEEKGLEIPFMFHAGETLLDTGGSKDPANSNLYDAVLLKSKRIGHGFSLMKHPHLIEKFKKTSESDGICIELCPISNELLHLCRNVKEHPYPQLLAAGIPCTVNSDNPSLFSNSMSHEFYQIMVGSPAISIHSWKQLALWSLEYSCLSKAEIEQGKKLFMNSWKDFCQEVISTYGHMFPGGDFNEEEATMEYEAMRFAAEQKEAAEKKVGDSTSSH